MSAAASSSPPRTDYIKLVSAEDFEFIIPREAAEQSRTLLSLLQAIDELAGSDNDADSNATRSVDQMEPIPLKDIGTRVLQLVCQYLLEKRCARHTLSEFKELKALDPTSEEDKQLVLELLLAADYLDC